jgi:hypothetical protein
MNALDPTVAEFRERLKHQRTEKRRRLNAMIDGATADDPSAFFENLSELANYYDPRAAFLRLRRHRTFPLSLRALFARCWVRYGDGWRKDVNDDLLVLDVLRCLLPPYEGPGLTLYRGDSAFNRRRRTYGMSWSASRGVAADFAQKAPARLQRRQRPARGRGAAGRDRLRTRSARQRLRRGRIRRRPGAGCATCASLSVSHAEHLPAGWIAPRAAPMSFIVTFLRLLRPARVRCRSCPVPSHCAVISEP